MNLIDKWKNRETKKKLREENIRLKEQLALKITYHNPIVTVERNIQCIQFKQRVQFEHGVPTDYIKESLAYGILEEIRPFIEYDFHDSPVYGETIYSGTIYIVTGDRKYEKEYRNQ